jgi:hypothetical protein
MGHPIASQRRWSHKGSVRLLMTPSAARANVQAMKRATLACGRVTISCQGVANSGNARRPGGNELVCIHQR